MSGLSWARQSIQKTLLLTTLLGVVAGCQMLRGPKPRIAVRPSSQEELADVRLLEKPYALAVPEDAIVRVVGQNGSELAGPSFDPSGSRIYFSSQRGGQGGITYEIKGPFRAYVKRQLRLAHRPA